MNTVKWTCPMHHSHNTWFEAWLCAQRQQVIANLYRRLYIASLGNKVRSNK